MFARSALLDSTASLDRARLRISLLGVTLLNLGAMAALTGDFAVVVAATLNLARRGTSAGGL